MAIKDMVTVRFKTGSAGEEKSVVEVSFLMEWRKKDMDKEGFAGDWWEEKKPPSGYLGEKGRGVFVVSTVAAIFYDEKARPQDDLREAMELDKFPIDRKHLAKGTKGTGSIVRSKLPLSNGFCHWELPRISIGWGAP